MDVEWEPGVPLYRNPRHVFDETTGSQQVVRRMIDVLEDHKDEELCGFCRNGWSAKAMMAMFEKEVMAA